MIVSLETAKSHLRVVTAEDDELITLYIGAAQEWIEKYLRRQVPNDSKAAQSAALLIIGGLYENRESLITGTIIAENPAVVNLLHPLRDQCGV